METLVIIAIVLFGLDFVVSIFATLVREKEIREIQDNMSRMVTAIEWQTSALQSIQRDVQRLTK